MHLAYYPDIRVGIPPATILPICLVAIILPGIMDAVIGDAAMAAKLAYREGDCGVGRSSNR